MRTGPGPSVALCASTIRAASATQGSRAPRARARVARPSKRPAGCARGSAKAPSNSRTFSVSMASVTGPERGRAARISNALARSRRSRERSASRTWPKTWRCRDRRRTANAISTTRASWSWTQTPSPSHGSVFGTAAKRPRRRALSKASRRRLWRAAARARRARLDLIPLSAPAASALPRVSPRRCSRRTATPLSACAASPSAARRRTIGLQSKRPRLIARRAAR